MRENTILTKMAKITLFDFSHENSNIWKSHEILQLWDISGDFQTLWVYVDFSCRIIITSSGIIHRPLLGLRWCHVVYLNVFRPQKNCFCHPRCGLKVAFVSSWQWSMCFFTASFVNSKSGIQSWRGWKSEKNYGRESTDSEVIEAGPQQVCWTIISLARRT